MWFKTAGVDKPEDRRSPQHPGAGHAGHGRCGGAGHRAADAGLFTADIADGRLVRIFDIVASDDRITGWPIRRSARTPKIRAFRDWVLAEMKRDVEWAVA